MTNSINKAIEQKASRRAAIKLGGLAVLSTATFAAMPIQTVGVAKAPDDSSCCGAQALPQDSVFTKVCNDDSAAKYGTGDNDNTYRIAALWLLLTTEDWATYLRSGHSSGEWIAGVSKELQLPQQVVQDLWDQVTSTSSEPHFKAVRATFQNFTADTALYGKRPCPGGKTAVDVACLAGTAAKATKPLH